MPENWLHAYLLDSVQKKLCVKFGCTTCGANEFRDGLWHSADSDVRTQSGARRIADALAQIEPSNREEEGLQDAVRLVLSIHRIDELLPWNVAAELTRVPLAA